MNDTGLWFVNGKVTTKKERDRVWAAHKKMLDRIYREEERLQDKHRKAMERIKAKRDKVKSPFTPWVGHVSEGAVTEFVDWAKRDYKRKRRNNETTDY